MLTRPARFRWPKVLPPLTEEQQRISDDFMKHWLTVLPERYGIMERFNHGYPARFARPGQRTLEIGAGRGAHLAYENLKEQDYHCVEFRQNIANDLRGAHPKATVVVADCQRRLPYPDAHFDRAIAIHILEHLPNLPAAVAELHRILKPGGVLAVVIPCDPGLAYEIARKISAERIFKKRYRMAYKWLIRREHINSPAEIFQALGQHFLQTDREYFPLLIPLTWANIAIGASFTTR